MSNLNTAVQAGRALQARVGNLDRMRSTILHRLGCLFLGSPKALGLPEDFYFARFDRDMPAPGEDTWQRMRFRVYTNRLRILMIVRLMKWLLALNIVVILGVSALYLVSTLVASSGLWQKLTHSPLF